jgi:hypothetical protein
MELTTRPGNGFWKEFSYQNAQHTVLIAPRQVDVAFVPVTFSQSQSWGTETDAIAIVLSA